MRYNLAQERIIIMEEILDGGIADMDKLEKAFEAGSGFDELIPDNAPTPQAKLEEKERRTALEQGLQKLSEEHRQVLLLREVSGLSYAEIAQIIGQEEGTVKSRIARARLSLRNILREDGNFFEDPPSKK